MSERLPLPAALEPNPFGLSCAEMETVKLTGPALVSTVSGDTLKLSSCGDVVSPVAAPANHTNAATAAQSLGRQRSLGNRSIPESRFFKKGLVSRSLGRNGGTRTAMLHACYPGSIGAGDGIRTRDIDLGKVALYQLSYSRPPQDFPFSPALCQLVKLPSISFILKVL